MTTRRHEAAKHAIGAADTLGNIDPTGADDHEPTTLVYLDIIAEALVAIALTLTDPATCGVLDGEHPHSWRTP
jgi:hypothetical protein